MKRLYLSLFALALTLSHATHLHATEDTHFSSDIGSKIIKNELMQELKELIPHFSEKLFEQRVPEEQYENLARVLSLFTHDHDNLYLGLKRAFALTYRPILSKKARRSVIKNTKQNLETLNNSLDYMILPKEHKSALLALNAHFLANPIPTPTGSNIGLAIGGGIAATALLSLLAWYFLKNRTGVKPPAPAPDPRPDPRPRPDDHDEDRDSGSGDTGSGTGTGSSSPGAAASAVVPASAGAGAPSDSSDSLAAVSETLAQALAAGINPAEADELARARDRRPSALGAGAPAGREAAQIEAAMLISQREERERHAAEAARAVQVERERKIAAGDPSILPELKSNLEKLVTARATEAVHAGDRLDDAATSGIDIGADQEAAYVVAMARDRDREITREKQAIASVIANGIAAGSREMHTYLVAQHADATGEKRNSLQRQIDDLLGHNEGLRREVLDADRRARYGITARPHTGDESDGSAGHRLGSGTPIVGGAGAGTTGAAGGADSGETTKEEARRLRAEAADRRFAAMRAQHAANAQKLLNGARK